MKKAIAILSLSLVTLFASCNKEEGKKRGIDYDKVKPELALTAEQEKQFDEITAKYQKIAEESRAAATKDGAKPDRIEMFKKMEERAKQQTEEMATFLDASQLEKYNTYVAKNSRKRPRYDDALLAKIKTDLQLNEQQADILEATNNAFEKSFHDAHDIYHGNSELAKEYWDKFDNERKNVLKKAFSEAQYTTFLTLVKDQAFKGKE